MDKPTLINEIKSHEGLINDEKADLIHLLNETNSADWCGNTNSGKSILFIKPLLLKAVNSNGLKEI